VLQKGEKTLPQDLFKAISPPPLGSLPSSTHIDLKVPKVSKPSPPIAPLTNLPDKKKKPAQAPTPQPLPKQTAKTPPAQVPAKKAAPLVPPPQRLPPVRRFQGPLFDFPRAGIKKEEGWPLVPPPDAGHWGTSIPVSFDIRDLLAEEEKRRLGKRQGQRMLDLETKLRKIESGELVVTPEVRTRLKVEHKKLRLLEVQGRVRDEVEEAQQGVSGINNSSSICFLY
jgi:hypothetical protein